MKKFLKEKLELQGGFKQNNVNNSSMSIQRNDIINEPKGNPENVINIIQNQQNKKKQMKLNYTHNMIKTLKKEKIYSSTSNWKNRANNI